MGREELTLVVGRSSFLARSFAAAPGRPACRFIGHDALGDASVFEGVGRIVNFAFDPRWRREDCPPERCLDRHLGLVAAERGLRYVMISSRKVYDPAHQWDAAEDAPAGPADAYGRNKLAAETALREVLGDRLLILRTGNVFGFEREPGRRTFMGAALESLAARGEIVLDVDPGVERDFLPDAAFGRILSAVLRRDLSGTCNLGSGAAVPLGAVAQWIIEGFGKGALRVVDRRRFDAFRLDVGRLRLALGSELERVPVEEHFRAAGRRLALDCAAQWGA